VRLLVVGAAVAVAAVPGAAARSRPALQLSAFGPAVISPNGNGIHDVLRVRVSVPAAARLELRAYVWGGRLHGWRQMDTGVTFAGGQTAKWGATTSSGLALRDGSYLVTVCYQHAGRRLQPVIAPSRQRPGAAEATISRPPWRRAGCLAKPRVVRVERVAAYIDSTGSFRRGEKLPLVVSADRGQASTQLEPDCAGGAEALVWTGRVPPGARPGLYHAVVRDPQGDEFRAPVVVRAPRRLDHPLPHTALVVWPYLTWRAYSSYDANLNGIPDSWYQFWRQRRASLLGPILPAGVEDDHNAAAPFSRWLCARSVRAQQVTDVELGRLPLSTLRRYAAIVFPGHSEYYEPATFDLLVRYRDEGGNLVFLQANPFYRQVRLDRAHNAMVLTDFDAREGRSDFAMSGVGYDGCCFPRSRAQPYVAAAGADFRRVRWLFRGTGVGPGESFGHAGSESDRIDPGLTPRDHVVAAEAIVAGKHGVINAAMVWSHAGRGQVFATGNYDFLRMRRSLSWTLLDNVWRRLVG
jgi:hypothetical protein